MVSCFDAKTGNPFYLQERLEAIGNYYASPVAAAGRIYFASLNGKVSVIKAALVAHTHYNTTNGQGVTPTRVENDERSILS